MFEPCAACKHEKNIHYHDSKTGQSRCLDCEATGRNCPNYVKPVGGD